MIFRHFLFSSRSLCRSFRAGTLRTDFTGSRRHNTREMLPEDIIKKVRKDFQEDDSLAVLQLLHEFAAQGIEPRDTFLRCIVYHANGDFDRFAAAVSTAGKDPRDIL